MLWWSQWQCHVVLLAPSFPKPHETSHSDNRFQKYPHLGVFNVHLLLLVIVLVAVAVATMGSAEAVTDVIVVNECSGLTIYQKYHIFGTFCLNIEVYSVFESLEEAPQHGHCHWLYNFSNVDDKAWLTAQYTYLRILLFICVAWSFEQKLLQVNTLATLQHIVGNQEGGLVADNHREASDSHKQAQFSIIIVLNNFSKQTFYSHPEIQRVSQL